MANTAFNRSGYSVDTGGYLRDVGQVSFSKLYDFHKSFYGPNNAHIIVTGPVSPSFILKNVLKHFGPISAEGRVPQRINREEEVQKGVRQVTVEVESPVCLLSMGYRNFKAMEKDSIVADLISEYLQHPSVGILSQLSEMSLMPQSFCQNSRMKSRFLFTITGSLVSDLPQMQTGAIGMIQQALLKLKTQLVDPNVLGIVKKSLENKWKNSIASVESLGSQLTEALASGNIGDVWQKGMELEGVTPQDILRVSRYLFQDERLTLGLLRRRAAPAVPRPLLKDADQIKQSMFKTPKELKNFLAPMQPKFKRMEEEPPRMHNTFGLYHRINLPSTTRVHLLLTAKSSTNSEALARIASKLIREGLPKIKLSHSKAASLAEYTKEPHANFSDVASSFNSFMILNNVDFDIAAPNGKLQFQITFDDTSDPREIMRQIAEGIRSLNYTTQQHVQEIQMKTNMLVGSWRGATSSPRYVAEKEITSRLFSENDRNQALDVERLVHELSTITFKDIERFKNDLFSTKGKPFIVSCAANPKISNQVIENAIQEFHQVMSPAFYSNEFEYEEDEMPYDFKPSLFKKIIPEKEKYIVRNLTGRNEGLSAIGVRCEGVDRNSKDFIALSVGLMVLGGGMNSLLMDTVSAPRPDYSLFFPVAC